ncbi:P27 family phage terminase small subunit [Clostridium butyricum]|uniref:P27 family phage terminase small subunit n=1 Tax=Clostridium butyricum TaxID=1492 RepID=UPI002AAFD759|nr:P27 family phage terminase small subunit [Clostridium butyricum]
MARPCKAINTQSRHNTKDEIKSREDTENKLRGLADKIKPPKNLTDSQKKIFKFIVNELKESDILSNLDIFFLEMASTTIDELRRIQNKVNEDIENIRDKDLMRERSRNRQELHRLSNELCLSPQSRAKIGSLILNADKDKQDPILSVLKRKKKENDNGHQGQ